jgi:N-acetylmuramoyl-L-alanine amidase
MRTRTSRSAHDIGRLALLLAMLFGTAAAEEGAVGESPWEAPQRVRLDGSPLSAVPGGSYWILPQPGAEVLADRRQEGWLRLPLALGLYAWCPEEHALRLGAGAPEEPRRLGPAVHSRRLENGDLELELPITGVAAPLWREEAGEGGADWRLILEHTVSRLDWIVLDPAAGLQGLDWEPRPGDELELRVALATGRFQGHLLRWEPGRLLLTLRHRPTRLKGARVLLDPGHGGAENGCVGASGTLEKELALSLARELKAELERAGAQVRLTRWSDSTLSLAARVEQARAWPADCLLSLHYNSVPEGQDPRSADGFMVFSWSPWSAGPARALHETLARRLPLFDRGLHWRSLGVCRTFTCPALLLEAGSLVHPEEEALLLEPAFRKRQVRAIRRGLEACFREGDGS